MKVESFELDHTKVKAPFVRKCCVSNGPNGDKVTKFDLRFTQPNIDEMQSEGIHTLEHIIATKLRDYLNGIIDISPMGCRTGFYMTVWGEPDVNEIINALTSALQDVLKATDIPAMNAVQCGNYKLHNLELAKKYAYTVLDKGISDKYML